MFKEKQKELPEKSETSISALIDKQNSSKSSLKLKKSSSVQFNNVQSLKKSSIDDVKAASLDDIMSHSAEFVTMRRSKSFHNLKTFSTLNVYYASQEFPGIDENEKISQQPTTSNVEETPQPLPLLLPADVDPSKRRKVPVEESQLTLRGQLHGETCSLPLSEILEKKKNIRIESRKRDKSASPGRAPYKPELPKRKPFSTEPKIVIIGEFQRCLRISIFIFTYVEIIFQKLQKFQ